MKQVERIGSHYVLMQDAKQFKLGMDTMALAKFATLRPGERVCDLGCGIGPLPLLLLSREERLSITGVELNPDAAHLARQNVTENKLENKVQIFCEDLRNVKAYGTAGAFDLVISNPPYFPTAAGKAAKGTLAQARSEVTCTIEELSRAAAYLLHPGGRFAVVFRPERLTALILALTSQGLEPKRMRFVQHQPQKAPSLVLMEAVRCGKPGLAVLAPFFIAAPQEKEK